MTQITYRDGYKYQLQDDYFHVLPIDFDDIQHFDNGFIKFNPSILLIRKGYAWDGPSGIAIDTKDFMRGSLVHDALYQCMREGFIPIEFKDICDKELARICEEDGMSDVRSACVYQAVRMFGYNSATKQREVITAP